MSILSSVIQQLTQSTRGIDPVLSDIIFYISRELDRQSAIIDPEPIVPRKVAPQALVRPQPPTGISYTLSRTNILISWNAPSSGFYLYEVRTNETIWSAATRITTTGNTSIILDPATSIVGQIVGLVGTHIFLVKSINSSGDESEEAISVNVIIPPIGSISITPNVINNFVTLAWIEPITTFNIDYYKIYRDGSLILDNVKGTFYVDQEQQAGTITLGVKAIDIAGNESSLSEVLVVVTGPTDFEIQDSITSILDGTINNGKMESDRIIFCIDLVTTYEDHFINNSWASPQEQIDDNFPLWIEPTETTGYYEEVFDFGLIYQNVLVSFNFVLDTIVGSFSSGLSIKVSDDNVTYGTANTSASFYASSLRYVKFRINITGSDAALLAFSDLVCSILIKRENDGGESDVFAADASGTVISFNKSFKIVESITVTPLETAIRSWIYDFAGGVNPTTFKVKVWNAAGTRVDGHVSWKSRGIL